MHEASLVSGLLATALAEVEKYNAVLPAGASPVLAIRGLTLDVGLIACVEEQTLKACFELMAEDTLAAGAKLTVQRLPLPCECRSCGKHFMLTQRHFVCPSCGGKDMAFNGGQGCTLSKLDVEVEENNHG
jgi:hydrogenase nickel incorporation protein HypA/HybF